MAPSIEVQLLARIDELARREGLLVAETGKARIAYDADALTVEALIAAVATAGGFEATVVTDAS